MSKSDLKDDVFDKRDKKMLEAIKDMVFKPLSKKLDYVSEKLEHIYNYLKKNKPEAQ